MLNQQIAVSHVLANMDLSFLSDHETTKALSLAFGLVILLLTFVHS